MVMKAFTRNCSDNSTEAGFQFTFFCDICGDGFKSSFIESESYKKRSFLRGAGSGASILGSLLGGKASNLGWAMERGTNVVSDRFEERSPEWQKEHEFAFNRAQNEAQQHFTKCPNCNNWVCATCFNDEQGLCTKCAPKENIYVAQARAQAMKRNVDEKAETATVWKGEIETKTTICPVCGKPAGSGKFCNNCGANLGLNKCPNCGSQVAQGVNFCPECGGNMSAPPAPAAATHCSNCGTELAPGAKFCVNCGTKTV